MKLSVQVSFKNFFLWFLGSERLRHLRKETGAEVHLDQQATPMPGMKTVIIRGLRSQIEETVKLIGQITGEQVCVELINSHYSATSQRHTSTKSCDLTRNTHIYI